MLQVFRARNPSLKTTLELQCMFNKDKTGAKVCPVDGPHPYATIRTDTSPPYKGVLRVLDMTTVTGARSQDIVPIITNRCALVLALSSTQTSLGT